MLIDSLKTKRCILVCGGGGVGKTTMAASLALAATHYRKRVLVVTIDPAKRLAEAFGYEMSDLEKLGAPLSLSPENSKKLGVPEGSCLSVGILNPKYVLEEILQTVLEKDQRDKLKKTVLYTQLSEMIYGLQEYTAYEWVTRMLQEDQYDLIILDTPPAFHAKDFFNAPDRITRMMESRVFSLFLPKKSWVSSFISFAWIEKLLGERLYRESRVFFEMFTLLRGRILERCQLLSHFFEQKEVEVLAVSTPDSSALHELEGLVRFLAKKSIVIHTTILNQVEQVWPEETLDAAPELKEKVRKLWDFQTQKALHAHTTLTVLRERTPSAEVIPVNMTYAEEGFEILRRSAASFIQ